MVRPPALPMVLLACGVVLGGCFTTRTQLEAWAADDGGVGDGGQSSAGGDGDVGGDGDSDLSEEACRGDAVFGGTLTPEGLPDGMVLSVVCPHTFEMGCTERDASYWCYPDELPVLPVTLSRGILIGATEVTRAQYAEVMGTDPSESACEGDDCPVETVTWSDAADFANRLSSLAGLTECYDCTGSGEDLSCEVAMHPIDCDGYRLPTEAEWEAAARCGSFGRYAGSSGVNQVGVWNTDRPSPVASLEPNDCATWDMSGNVAEWTQDWYAMDRGSSALTDPTGALSGDSRSLRNAWYDTELADNLAVYRRLFSQPHIADPRGGIRVVRTLD